MDLETVKRMIAEKRSWLSQKEPALHQIKMEIEDLRHRAKVLEEKAAPIEESVRIAQRDISQLQSLVTETPGTDMAEEYGVGGDKALLLDAIDYSDGEPRARPQTIELRKAAAHHINSHGPSTTAELANAIQSMGLSIGGHSPIANLSAMLSRTSFFFNRNRKWHLEAAQETTEE